MTDPEPGLAGTASDAAPKSSFTRRRVLKAIFMLAFWCLVIIAFVSWYEKLPSAQQWRSILSADRLGGTALLLLALLAAGIFRGLRWAVLLRFSPPLPARTYVTAYGWFFFMSAYTFMRLGDVYRLAFVRKHGGSIATASGAWVAERLLDLVVMMILLGASLPFLSNVPERVRDVGPIWLAVFAVVYIGVSLFSGRGRDWLVRQIDKRAKASGPERWHRALSNLAIGMSCLSRPATNIWGFLLTLAVWASLGAGTWAYLASYFPSLTYPVALYALILINFSGALNLSPANIGIHQMAGVIALRAADIPASDALVALVGLQAINLLFIPLYAVICRGLLYRLEPRVTSE